MDDKPTFQIKVDKKKSAQKGGAQKHKGDTPQQKGGVSKLISPQTVKNQGNSAKVSKSTTGTPERATFKTSVRKTPQPPKKAQDMPQKPQGKLAPDPAQTAKEIKQNVEAVAEQIKNDQTVKQVTQTASDVANQVSKTAGHVATEVKDGVGTALSEAQSLIESSEIKEDAQGLFYQLKESGLLYYQSHRRQVLYGAIGFIVALGILIIGLPKIILISLLTFIGVAIGQYVDGKPYIVRFFTDFIKRQ